jgi:hypothetical protein
MAMLSADLLAHELAQLVALATDVMNEHQNDHDLCAICGSAWPCERVVLAEHNFSVI